MSDATHTPGPWHNTGDKVFDGVNDLPIATAWPPFYRRGGTKPVTAEANAALIARAPDLLAQLAQVTAERDEMERALKAIVAGLSQPVQTCEPSARTAAILLGDCTFARQTAKTALEMFTQ